MGGVMEGVDMDMGVDMNMGVDMDMGVDMGTGCLEGGYMVMR